jgi:hypothetical protein
MAKPSPVEKIWADQMLTSLAMRAPQIMAKEPGRSTEQTDRSLTPGPASSRPLNAGLVVEGADHVEVLGDDFEACGLEVSLGNALEKGFHASPKSRARVVVDPGSSGDE